MSYACNFPNLDELWCKYYFSLSAANWPSCSTVSRTLCAGREWLTAQDMILLFWKTAFLSSPLLLLLWKKRPLIAMIAPTVYSSPLLLRLPSLLFFWKNKWAFSCRFANFSSANERECSAHSLYSFLEQFILSFITAKAIIKTLVPDLGELYTFENLHFTV